MAAEAKCKVHLPAVLKKYTKDQVEVECAGTTIQECLEDLERRYPGIKERICDETGQIRRFVNIFVDGEDIRFKKGPATPVSEGSEISIVPAIAGG